MQKYSQLQGLQEKVSGQLEESARLVEYLQAENDRLKQSLSEQQDMIALSQRQACSHAGQLSERDNLIFQYKSQLRQIQEKKL